MNMNFYEFNQNNTGGTFDCDDKVCHRIIIEAENFNKAVNKAESLGCYWNGVENGYDCECCGDRWSKYFKKPINLDEYRTNCIEASVYISKNEEEYKYKNRWNKKYGNLPRKEDPSVIKKYSSLAYSAKIYFENIEQYAQYYANAYGWTTPDIRIYYANGEVKEIFTEKVE